MQLHKAAGRLMGTQQRLDTLPQLGIGPAFVFEQQGTVGRRSGLDSGEEKGLHTLGIDRHRRTLSGFTLLFHSQ
jgi:hypothetical protein